MKKKCFALMVLFVSGVCFAEMQPTIPPFDTRIQRGEYVASLIKSGAIGAEIGVCEGIFAYHVLLQKEPKKLCLIDPWQYGLQQDIETEITAQNQFGRDKQYEHVCDVFQPYKNVEIIRMKSEDAAGMFQDNYFDYVYIDGEHSYAAVTRDLNNYFSKVKVGGYIIGDDYGWTGIAPAVQDFLKTHQGQCKFLDDPYRGRTGGQFAILKIK